MITYSDLFNALKTICLFFVQAFEQFMKKLSGEGL